MNLVVARAKLVARYLTFPSPAKPTFTSAAAVQLCSNSYTTKASKKEASVGDLWSDLARNPRQWYDYRPHKLNELVSRKHPDFKRKDTDDVLWVDTIPRWVLPEFEKFKFDVKEVARREDLKFDEKEVARRKELWKSLLEDHSKWWDDRLRKKTPNSPDFVHKESKEALWVDNAPFWVLPELEKLGSFDKKEAKGDDLWKKLLEDPSKWWDNRVGKKNPKAPDFKHSDTGEALWIQDAPTWVLPVLEKLQFCDKKEAKGDELWKTLLEDPSKWWDNRVGKKTPKAPDFKHSDTGEALWIQDAPTWVLPVLEKLQFCDKNEAKGDDFWKTLLEDPSKWWDKRVGKKNPKAPDFKHMETGEPLWIEDAPTWALTELENLGAVQWEGIKEARDEESWKSLVEDPSKWWDKRVGKKNPKAPDFKHMETGEPLWINSAPSWALTKLENLGAVQWEGIKKARDEESWKSLVEDPSEWWDNRVGKKNPRAPDFKHMETGEALWIQDARLGH